MGEGGRDRRDGTGGENKDLEPFGPLGGRRLAVRCHALSRHLLEVQLLWLWLLLLLWRLLLWLHVVLRPPLRLLRVAILEHVLRCDRRRDLRGRAALPAVHMAVLAQLLVR